MASSCSASASGGGSGGGPMQPQCGEAAAVCVLPIALISQLKDLVRTTLEHEAQVLATLVRHDLRQELHVLMEERSSSDGSTWRNSSGLEVVTTPKIARTWEMDTMSTDTARRNTPPRPPSPSAVPAPPVPPSGSAPSLQYDPTRRWRRATWNLQSLRLWRSAACSPVVVLEHSGPPDDAKRSALKEAGSQDCFAADAIVPEVSIEPPALASIATSSRLSASCVNDAWRWGTRILRRSALLLQELAEEQRSNLVVFSTYRRIIRSFVQHDLFSYASCVAILMNAITIGWEVDYTVRSAQAGEAELPQHFQTMEIIFCVCFAIELLLRFGAHGCAFFTMRGWYWNVFDTLIVCMQLMEQFIVSFGREESSVSDVRRARAMRFMRVLKLLRGMRVLRVVPHIYDLSKIVYLIAGAMVSFCWTVCLLFILTYAFGLVVTQLVADYCSAQPQLKPDPSFTTTLLLYYGSLPTSVLSLYQAITGGIDWADLLSPLVDAIHPTLAILFMVYIAFAVLVMLNLVTGVFVEGAQRLKKQDRDREIMRNVRSLYVQADIDASGCITWGEFERQLDNPKMKELFKDIDLGLCKAEELFRLLDTDGSGKVSAEQFVMGGVRLQGPARAIDLVALVHENKANAQMFLKRLSEIERCVMLLLQRRCWGAEGDSAVTSLMPDAIPRRRF